MPTLLEDPTPVNHPDNSIQDDRSGGAPQPSRRALRPLARSFALNTGVPLLAYYLLRSHVGNTVALAGGAAIPAAATLITLAWHRRLDPIGLISMAGFAVAVLISVLAGGSTLALELREPAVTGSIGLACVVSVVARRPLHLAVLRLTGHRNPQAAQIASDPASLRKSAVITVLIGAICLAHAAVATALALTLPVGTFLAVSHPVGLSIFGVGLATLLWYRRRHPAGSDTSASPSSRPADAATTPASRPDRP